MKYNFNNISSVVFDIGNVFSFENPKLKTMLLEGIVKVKKEVTHCCPADEVIFNTLQDNWTGLHKEAEHYPLWMALQRFHHLNHNQGISSEFSDMWFTTINTRSVAAYTNQLLLTLKENGYKIYYLSNVGQYAVEIQRKLNRLDFIDLMHGGVYSFETHWLKPDRRIYKFFLEKYNIDPSHALFLDDKPENIEAAREEGFKAEIFSANVDSRVHDTPILRALMNLPSIA